MKQFTKTKLFNLDVGDRFYYVVDKNKKVHQLISFGDRFRYVKKDTEIHDKKVKTDKDVIFLRHSNENN